MATLRTTAAPTDMPPRERSSLFFPRPKQGDDTSPGPLTRQVRINYETLEGLFHLNLKDAARVVGLGTTTFKKACRRLNIQKWTTRLRSNAQTDGVYSATTRLHRAVNTPTRPMRSVHEVASSSSNALDTRSWGENRHAAPAFEHKTLAPLDGAMPREAGRSCVEAALDVGPPGEWSCVEAVMDYLDGPFALDFDFMFADEEGACELV